MKSSIPDIDFHKILDNHWEDIACFAYEGYSTKGRGTVFLEKKGNAGSLLEEQIQMGYAIYDYEAGRPDKDSARLIMEYDPKWEVVIQYMQDDGSVRTMRLITAAGARHPWRIWLFDRMMQKNESERHDFLQDNGH